jgi:hypothetical protein
VERDLPEVEISERGDVSIWIKLNASFCGINRMNKTYYVAPEQDPDNYVNYTGEINVDGSCTDRDYYESAKFNFLEKNFTEGIYDFYRSFNDAPLFMAKVRIKGKLPSATMAKHEEEINATLANKLMQAIIDFLDFIRQYFQGEPFRPSLSVIAVKWVHVGDIWRVEANYTDQKGIPVTKGYCTLNTDKWGTLDMIYNWEKKVHVVEHRAEPVGEMRWTVACY